MIIGSYPYLMNPSGVGGLYAAAVASQPVQPIAAVARQSSGAFIKFGGGLTGFVGYSADASGGGQTSQRVYTPGSTLDISA